MDQAHPHHHNRHGGIDKGQNLKTHLQNAQIPRVLREVADPRESLVRFAVRSSIQSQAQTEWW